MLEPTIEFLVFYVGPIALVVWGAWMIMGAWDEYQDKWMGWLGEWGSRTGIV